MPSRRALLTCCWLWDGAVALAANTFRYLVPQRPPAGNLLLASRQSLLEATEQHGAHAFIGAPVEGDPDMGVNTCDFASGVKGGKRCKGATRCSRCELMKCARVGLCNSVVLLPWVPIFLMDSMVKMRNLVTVLETAGVIALDEDGREMAREEIAKSTGRIERRRLRGELAKVKIERAHCLRQVRGWRCCK